jgi:sialic acid synthase SpsE
LKSGDKLKKDDLDVKRPGTGLPPDKIRVLVGKTLLRDIERGTLIMEADVSE